jgi:GNAT superfamily N-acetyltransferase
MEIKIFKPNESHLTDLISLWRGQYDYHHGLDPVYYVNNSEDLDKKFEDYTKKAINDDEPMILIAEVDGELVGFVTYNKESNDYMDSNITEYGVVIELFVKESFRGKGIGALLLNEVEKYFKSQGMKFMEIQCSTFNDNALKFYSSKNYKNRQTFVFKDLTNEEE